MNPRNSLRRRIARAYLLCAAAAVVFFAITATVAVEGIEQRLVDDRLQEVAMWASPRYASGLSVAMPAGFSFHHGAAIPLSLRSLGAGVREVHVDGVGLHVLSGRDTGGEFVVVDHESDYEKVELVVYSLFLVASGASVSIALFFGRYIGRRVVTPILELADAVSEDTGSLPLLDRSDELGTLARAFANHTTQLRGFLERERFFTGDVSHELRTPLTIISGAAEILLEQHAGQPQIARPAERILRAANEAAECINVLLMLARSPERMVHPATDIGAIAQAETARYQALVAGKPVLLGCLAGPPFKIGAPPELCAALIGNLIRNACQYTESGTVLVRVGERSLAVEDSGPGMPAGVLATLAGGGPAPRDGPSSGTGLGLALVRRICEYLGASLEARMREGGGTVFEIHFKSDLTKS